MIRFRLKERVADWEFREGRRLTLAELSEIIGVNRSTLSKIANVKGYNTTTDNIDKLCQFFKCDVKDLMEVAIEQDSVS
ncbi:MAG: transcriptional regulator [Zetaproteobacteria bacterium]|nr:MAG: transcriptional regulator [Zetaproteobacteria bacterium]